MFKCEIGETTTLFGGPPQEGVESYCVCQNFDCAMSGARGIYVGFREYSVAITKIEIGHEVSSSISHTSFLAARSNCLVFHSFFSHTLVS